MKRSGQTSARAFPRVGSSSPYTATEPDRPRVFFDVDDTILTWDRQLRPFTREVMVTLTNAGFVVALWSGAGVRWEVAHVHDLVPLVSACYLKPLSRHRERLLEFGITNPPDHVVDDDEEIVAVFGGTVVPAPIGTVEEDREMLRVLADIERRFPAHGPLRVAMRKAERGQT